MALTEDPFRWTATGTQQIKVVHDESFIWQTAKILLLCILKANIDGTRILHAHVDTQTRGEQSLDESFYS